MYCVPACTSPPYTTRPSIWVGYKTLRPLFPLPRTYPREHELVVFSNISLMDSSSYTCTSVTFSSWGPRRTTAPFERPTEHVCLGQDWAPILTPQSHGIMESILQRIFPGISIPCATASVTWRPPRHHCYRIHFSSALTSLRCTHTSDSLAHLVTIVVSKWQAASA